MQVLRNVGLIALLLVIGIGIISGAKSPEQKAIEQAELLVRAELRDPGSAQFAGVRQHGDAICGQVNARNGFGGYGGTMRFVAWPQAGVAMIDDTSPENRAINTRIGLKDVFGESWVKSGCDR